MDDRPTILLINPNTSAGVTERLAEEARAVIGAAAHVRAVTAPFGAAAIQTPAELAVGIEAVEAAFRGEPACDAVIVAAFADPGMERLRGLSAAPVFGIGEEGMLAAAAGGRRFAIVTVGPVMRPSILAKVEGLGLSGALAGLHFLEGNVAEVVRDRAAFAEAILAKVAACREEDGAAAVLLGGGPFAGLARELSGAALPVVDGARAAAEAALAHVTGAPLPSLRGGAADEAT